MRYIQKLAAPAFFIQDTQDLVKWEGYYSSKKTNLKKHILSKEQFEFCCYCEKKLTSDKESSHVEHIKPKGNELYKELTFVYTNLIVSCQGDTYNEEENGSKNTCGHRKNNDFDEDLFLDPTQEKDIRKYFSYDYKGTIKPSDIQPDRAVYTINLLNLNGNNGLLAEARKKSLIALRGSISKLGLSSIDKKKNIQMILAKDKREYSSFLRARLSPFKAG